MNKLKFALGPYEVFAAIIGGSPLVLAIFLFYSPIDSLQDAFFSIKAELSLPFALLVGFLSYLLGGIMQGVTWKYFLMLCRVFRRDYRYFGNKLVNKQAALASTKESADTKSLDFEDKLVLRLHEKIGIPSQQNWMTPRLTAYLKVLGSEAVVTAESYLASHIMYRNLSFGFLILPAAILVNSFRSGVSFETTVLLILFSFLMAYLSFFRALSFKQWQDRELLLGFYFSAERRM